MNVDVQEKKSSLNRHR